MKLWQSTSLSSSRRRLAFWTRAGLAGAGVAAAATGGLVASLGHSSSTAIAPRHPSSVPAPAMRPVSVTQNQYYFVAADGGIFPEGGAPGYGSVPQVDPHPLNSPVVGMAMTPTGNGYYVVAADGGLWPFGDALQHNYGSVPALHLPALNQPIVGMAVTKTGKGYWMVAADGGLFPFGDAASLGSIPGLHIAPLNKPIVAILPTPTGRGYWMAASDGGLFPFGDAYQHSYGSVPGLHLPPLNKPINAMAATPSGNGYYMAAADGGLFPFGDATQHSYGSLGSLTLNKPIVGFAVTQTGLGYWFGASDGGIFTRGDAVSGGTEATHPLNSPIVGLAARPVLFADHASLSASPSSVAADGVSGTTMTASFTASGVGLPGVSASVTVDTPGCGSVSPSQVVSGYGGTISFTYTSSTALKSCTVSVHQTYGSLTASTAVAQIAGTAASVIGTTGTTATADTGSSPGIPASFTVLDSAGHPVSGRQLDFTTTLPGGSTSPTSAVTDANGVAGTTLHATTVGSGVVTATVHGTSVHGSTGSISITPGKVDSITLTTPNGVVAGTQYSLTAHAKDHWGNVATPANGTVAVDPANSSACDPSPAPSSTAASCPDPTFSNGAATINVTSYLAQATATFTLNDATNTFSGGTVVGNTSYPIAPAAAHTLTGTSNDWQPVHLANGTTPNGFYFLSYIATHAQTASVSLTLTDLYDNVETGNNSAVTVTRSNGATDSGSVPPTVQLTNGLGTLTYTTTDPNGGGYASPWGQGTISWSLANVTSAPSSVLVTTTNVKQLFNSVSGNNLNYNADQVSNAGASKDGLQIQFTASDASTTVNGVPIDFTEAGFDGTPTGMPAFTDCSNDTTAITQATTATSGMSHFALVCPHPAKVNHPATPSQGTVTGWVDGSPVNNNSGVTNSVTSTISITPGAISTLTLTGSAAQTAGQAFNVTATARDAEANLMNPTEQFNGSFNPTESVTCNATTSTASASIPANSAFSDGAFSFPVTAYVARTGDLLTMTGATSGVHGTFTFDVASAAPTNLTWTTAPTSFTADGGNTGQNYAVTVQDAFCNAVSGQAVSVTTTLGHATAKVTGSQSAPAALPITVTSASNGVGALTLFDTTVDSGVLTANLNSLHQATTIIVTAGKLAVLTVDTPGSAQTVGTQTSTTVHAADNFGNAVTPTHVAVLASSSALGTAPDGSTPSATLGSFSPSGAATLTSTPFLAQSGAVLSVRDSTTSETLNGATITGSTNGYVINPGPLTHVFFFSTSADYSAANAKLTLSSANEVVSFTVRTSDDHGNFAGGSNGSDGITVTLTPGTLADGGKLGATGGSTTASDTGGAVSLTLTLTNGAASFSYIGASTPPLSTNTGTLKIADTTDSSKTPLPIQVDIVG